MNNLPAKTCLACTKPLKGRSDKKFCEDYCRNTYNNRQNSQSNKYTRNVIHALQKNKRILQSFLGEQSSVKISRDLLLLKGFIFNYHTHTLETRKGNVYRFCFETGYTSLQQDRILVVKRDAE